MSPVHAHTTYTHLLYIILRDHLLETLTVGNLTARAK